MKHSAGKPLASGNCDDCSSGAQPNEPAYHLSQVKSPARLTHKWGDESEGTPSEVRMTSVMISTANFQVSLATYKQSTCFTLLALAIYSGFLQTGIYSVADFGHRHVCKYGFYRLSYTPTFAYQPDASTLISSKSTCIVKTSYYRTNKKPGYKSGQLLQLGDASCRRPNEAHS